MNSFLFFQKERKKILRSTFFLFQLKKTRNKQETVAQTLRFSILHLLSLFDTHVLTEMLSFFQLWFQKFPKATWPILLTEFGERFSYYGIKSE